MAARAAPITVALTPPISSPHLEPDESSARAEVAEFAEMLRIAQADRGGLARMGSSAPAGEIDDYENLVADPIKSRFAADPNFFHRIKADLINELVTRRLPRRPHALLRALDVGCGTGTLLTYLDRRFGYVRGCDPSRRLVRAAGAKACHMPSSMCLPFDDASFDVAVCACVYHHIAPTQRPVHVQEIRRVLAPGGLLLIFEHNRRNPLTRLIVRRCPIDSGAKLLTGGQARQLLRQAGFLRVRSRSYLFLPQLVYQAVGWIERVMSFSGLGGQFCTYGTNPGPAPANGRTGSTALLQPSAKEARSGCRALG